MHFWQFKWKKKFTVEACILSFELNSNIGQLTCIRMLTLTSIPFTMFSIIVLCASMVTHADQW